MEQNEVCGCHEAILGGPTDVGGQENISLIEHEPTDHRTLVLVLRQISGRRPENLQHRRAEVDPRSSNHRDDPDPALSRCSNQWYGLPAPHQPGGKNKGVDLGCAQQGDQTGDVIFVAVRGDHGSQVVHPLRSQHLGRFAATFLRRP